MAQPTNRKLKPEKMKANEKGKERNGRQSLYHPTSSTKAQLVYRDGQGLGQEKNPGPAERNTVVYLLFIGVRRARERRIYFTVM